MPPSADPFVAKFLSRIPKNTADSFDSRQLAAIKTAFGDRRWGSHWVDIRRAFTLGGYHKYFVLLVGRERRSDDRLAFERAMRPAVNVASATVLGLMGLIVIGGILGGLYVAKMSLGVDVIPFIDTLPDDAIKRWFEWLTK